jgi:predicted O-methyltransferase YrrM
MNLNQLAWKLDGTRPMIHYIAENMKPTVAAEIGVWRGENALSILKNLPSLKKLILIDPYLPYVDGDKSNTVYTNPSPYHQVATQRLSKYADKLEWRFFKSLDAAKLMHVESLDFVYIDGDHTYENVKDELEAYWPLIKRGGVMGGHDINFYGVMRAVGEFAMANKRHPNTDSQDWWIVKK